MINVLYIHGFGSSALSKSSKVEILNKEFMNVFRVAPDYSKGYDESLNEIIEYISFLYNKGIIIESVIGTSMGGYMAPIISDLVGVPYVSINPSCEPKDTLKKYSLGSMAESFKDFEVKPGGMFIVGVNDEIISPEKIIKLIKSSKFEVKLVKNEFEDHRFSNISPHIGEIAEFLYSSQAHGPSKEFYK